MMRTLPMLSFVISASFASACGGSTDGDLSGGSAGAGARAGGGGAGAGGAGAGGSGAGGGQSCDAYKDAKPGAEVTVQFQHSGSGGAIYILPKVFDCGEKVLFRLSNSKGTELLLEPSDCGVTCEQLQTNPGGCGASCQTPRVLRVANGSSYDYKWSGATYDQVDMPSQCFLDPLGGKASCRRRTTPAPGTYTIAAEAAGECIDCVCDFPNGSGFCTSYTHLPVLKNASASISFPSDSFVTVSF